MHYFRGSFYIHNMIYQRINLSSKRAKKQLDVPPDPSVVFSDLNGQVSGSIFAEALVWQWPWFLCEYTPARLLSFCSDTTQKPSKDVLTEPITDPLQVPK